MNEENIFGNLPEETKQVSQALDKLKKSLNGLAEAASSLDALADSLKNLKSVSNSLEKLTQVADGLSNLTPALNEFRTAIRYLDRLNQPLQNLTTTFIELKDATKFLKQFGKQLGSIGKTSNVSEDGVPSKIDTTVEADIEKVSVQTDKSAKNAEKAAKEFDKLGKSFLNLKKIFSITGIIYLFRRFSQNLSRTFKISNDYIEILNLFTVAMGDAAQGAKDVVEEWQKVLGLDPALAMEHWGELRLLLQGFGDSSQEWETAITSMSQNLTQLSYDLASLYNVDPTAALAKIQSAMSGMTRPLRAWGIDVSTPSLEVFAKEKGIEKSIHLMSQAEKAQLRYMLIMEKTSKGMMDAQGDLAKTLTTAGNAMRILKQRFTQLGRAIGDFISPIITHYIPYVVAFVKLLTNMFVNLAEVMGRLTGYQKQGIEDFQKVIESFEIKPAKTIDALNDTFQLIQDVVSGKDFDMDNDHDYMKDWLEDTVKKTNKATEAVEEYEDALYGLVSGIDKFNVLSQATEGTGVSIFLTPDDTKAYDFFEGLKDQSKEIEEKLAPAFKKVEDAIAGALEVMLLLKTTLSKLNISLKDFIDFIVAIIAFKLGASIVSLVDKLIKLKAAYNAMSAATVASKASLLLTGLAVGALLYSLYSLVKIIKDLVRNWDELNNRQRAGRIILAAVALAGIALGIAALLLFYKQSLLAVGIKTSLLPALKATMVSMLKLAIPVYTVVAGIALIGAGIALFMKNSSNMGPLQKLIIVFTALAVAIAAVAIAKSALFGLGLGAGLTAAAIGAGVVLTAGSIWAANSKKKFAEGGLPGRGGLFIAGERGPEWIGKQGNSSVVVNDAQMSDIMYRSVKDGVVDAMIRTGDTSGGAITFNFNGVDRNEFARVMFRPMMDEMKRQGYKVERS